MTRLVELLSGGNPKEAMEAVSRLTGKVLDKMGLDSNPRVQDMRQGLTIAQSMGLTRDELDAIYFLGFQKLNAGDAEAARDVFTQLVTIDPLHAPNHYCLAVTLMQLGDWDAAENMILAFLALDATNPVGYLRFGEICLQRGDKTRARDAFRLAEAECLAGHGDAITLGEARSKLALLTEEMKG